jgi:hypothetical protein
MVSEPLLVACVAVQEEAGQAFARLAERGYRPVERTGRYPRVRAERDGRLLLGIDFWMCLDERGRYRTEWSRLAPFELGGAAAIIREENTELIQYWKPYVLYDARPYEVALRSLAADVIVVAEAIEAWTEETIVGTGKRVQVRRRQNT